jgi:(p)ppGpp synthase/HD superfamily hydrolase
MFGLTSRFDQAQNFAARLHRFQTRKGSHVPYLGHLLGVASIVIDAGGTEDQAIAALLHDAIEDAGGEETRLEIEGRFGSNVANIVVACSDTAQHPKPPWRERKEQYLEHLEIVSEQVLLVSLADKLYNVRSMLLDYAAVGEALWDRFRVGRDRQLWYYRSLGEVFSRRFPGPLSAELVSLVKRLEQAA